MKASDALILREINEIDKLLAVQQKETRERFDSIDKDLQEILRKLNIDDQPKHISKELEKALKESAIRATGIDRKVPSE